MIAALQLSGPYLDFLIFRCRLVSPLIKSVTLKEPPKNHGRVKTKANDEADASENPNLYLQELFKSRVKN